MIQKFCSDVCEFFKKFSASMLAANQQGETKLVQVKSQAEGIDMNQLMGEDSPEELHNSSLKEQFQMLVEFADRHNQKLISTPKRRFKVSELAQFRDKLHIAQLGSSISEGTLGKRADPIETLSLHWDVRSVGSKIKISKDCLFCSTDPEIEEGKYHTVVCTTSFDSGVVGWELELIEERPGDIRVGVCKTKILNNDECFTNFGIGFAVSSDGQTKNGSTIKSSQRT